MNDEWIMELLRFRFSLEVETQSIHFGGMMHEEGLPCMPENNPTPDPDPEPDPQPEKELKSEPEPFKLGQCVKKLLVENPSEPAPKRNKGSDAEWEAMSAEERKKYHDWFWRRTS